MSIPPISLSSSEVTPSNSSLSNRDFTFNFGAVNLAGQGSSIDNLPSPEQLNSVGSEGFNFSNAFIIGAVAIAGIIALRKAL